MDRERWQRLSTLIDQAFGFEDTAACEAWLSTLPPDEAQAVRRALADAQAAPQAVDMPSTTGTDSARFDRLLGQVLQREADGGATPDLSGTRLGAWRLDTRIGEGGMGQVYLGERADGLYEQRVAIKLLRGLTTEAAREQFARERRILATLSHPHIARLIDGGTTDEGRPWLAMERVEGRRIDDWCRQLALPLAERLALFDQVCAALMHAHGQLIVHCDIKPGNVFVGADGRAMLLDFGIAQLQGAGEAGSTSLTPRYASPEQRAGQPATAASDIYSLGRLLDELLEAAPDAARRREEWKAVVARATAASPAGRYASVDALRRDLQRFSQHWPLEALQRRPAYVAAKFVRRRWPVLLVAVAAGLMTAGFVWRLMHERDQAEAARAEAVQQAATTAQVSEFIVSLFEGADPIQGGRPDVSALELVDKGRARVDEQLAGQPQMQATMKGVLAKVYENVGQPPKAMEQFEQAIALERRLDPPRPLQEASLLSQQAMALANNGLHAKAVEPARRALALQQQHGPERHAALADAHNTLGWVLARNDRHDEARRELDQALALRRTHLGPRHWHTAVTLHNLGMLEARRDRLAEAVDFFRQALDIKRGTLGAGHPRALYSVQALAAALGQMGQRDEALPLLQELVAARTAIYGPDSEYVGAAEHELAVVLRDLGRTEEALAMYRRSMQSKKLQHGERSLSMAVSLNNVAGALESLGDPEAGTHYRQSLAIRRERLAPGDPALARAEANLGRWLLRNGQAAEARPLVLQSSAVREQRLPPAHVDRQESRLLQAQLALAEGRLDDAEALLQQPSTTTGRTGTAVEQDRLLADLRQAQGRHAEALALRQQALQRHLQRIGPLHPDGVWRHVELAEAQARVGDRPAVRQTLAALQANLQRHHPQSPARARVAALQRQ